jgi:hypothetical protein
MKASELTHMIRQIVAEEIRRELPNAIAEVFQNFMGQREPIQEQVQPAPVRQRSAPQPEPPQNEETLFKQSLREVFAGTGVVPPRQQAPVGPRKLAKDPLLNEILNATRPFSAQERTGAPAGMAAMMAAAQAGVAMPGDMPDMPMMEEGVSEEPAFVRNMPTMNLGNARPQIPMASPVSQAQLLRDDHIPLSDLPQGVSVHDVKQYAPPAVTEALTRDYSKFMKLVDKKRGKVV